MKDRPELTAADRLRLIKQISDLMTAAGATLTEHQENVLYAALKVLDVQRKQE